MTFAKRLQFNLDMKPIPKIEWMRTMPKILFPLFWVEESASLDKELTDQLKNTVFLYAFNCFYLPFFSAWWDNLIWIIQYISERYVLWTYWSGFVQLLAPLEGLIQFDLYKLVERPFCSLIYIYFFCSSISIGFAAMLLSCRNSDSIELKS